MNTNTNQEHARDVNSPPSPARVIRPKPEPEPETPAPARPALLSASAIVGPIVMHALLGLYRALIFYKFYGWFVLTIAVLHAPALSYGATYGIVLTLGALRMTSITPKTFRDAMDSTTDDARKATTMTLAVWTLAFLIGYVAHVVMRLSVTVG